MRKVDHLALYDNELNTWIRKSGEYYKIGLTDWAQKVIGDINGILDLPKVGDAIISNMLLCTVESDKSTKEILIPTSGKVISINPLITTDLSLINMDPYGQGWIIEIIVDDPSDIDSFMSAAAYEEAISSFFRKS